MSANLDLDAEKRRQRLQDMRRRRDNERSQASEAEAPMKYRNYDAETKGPRLGFSEPPEQTDTVDARAEAIEERARREAAEARQRLQEPLHEVDALDEAGLQEEQEKQARDAGDASADSDDGLQRPDADLRRLLGKKLELVRGRTEQARAKYIRQTIRERQAALAQIDAGP